ncbi:MAG: hypothetical protein F6K41_30950 [Symploca sp. SIO3E6]|nr:hypothetical protein [Caldora sp. SIO3E6]
MIKIQLSVTSLDLICSNPVYLAEGRRQKAEGRRQKAEGRGQRAEGRRQSR